MGVVGSRRAAALCVVSVSEPVSATPKGRGRAAAGAGLPPAQVRRGSACGLRSVPELGRRGSAATGFLSLRALRNFEFSVLKMPHFQRRTLQKHSTEMQSTSVWGGRFLGNFVSWLPQLTYFVGLMFAVFMFHFFFLCVRFSCCLQCITCQQ